MALTWQPHAQRWWISRLALVGGAAVVVAIAWYVSLSQDGPGTAPLTVEAWNRLWHFVSRLLGFGLPASESSYTDGETWRRVASLAIDTIVMSVVAVGLAGAGALATLPFGTRPATDDPNPRRARVVVAHVVRAIYTLAHAVPELVWAFLVVFVLRPGILAGAVALAIHNFGVVGRLAVDIAENADRRPLAAIRSSGANDVQAFAYGSFPMVLPGMLTYLLFRWEVIIRTTVVVGFVVGAGLGYQFRLDLSFFRYTHLGVLLLAYLAIVLMVDVASAALRRLAA